MSMSQVPRPERYLELFDQLDLDNIEDRRIGVHLLRSYFSTVLTKIAEEKLEIMNSINQDSLDKQWRLVRGKFETVPGQLPHEIEKAPFQIIEARNPVTHNDRYDPNQDIGDLQEIRDQAPEWRNEVEQLAESYFHAWEDLSPKEALIDLAEQNLQRVLAAQPRFDNFDEKYSNMHDVAEMTKNQLDQEVDSARNHIEKDLVEVVRTAQGLRKKLSELEKQEMEYEDYLMNEELDRMRGR
jgi:hypothetical protein